MSDRVHLGRVAAPNRSPKPVVCGIGDLDRLVDGAVLDQRPQRTEVFELHVVGVGGRVVEDRDWKEVAFPFDLIAALAPMIQGLTRAVNSFNKSAGTQAQTIEANLQQTQAVGAAVTRLMQEIRAAEAARSSSGPWGSSH